MRTPERRRPPRRSCALNVHAQEKGCTELDRCIECAHPGMPVPYERGSLSVLNAAGPPIGGQPPCSGGHHAPKLRDLLEACHASLRAEVDLGPRTSPGAH